MGSVSQEEAEGLKRLTTATGFKHNPSHSNLPKRSTDRSQGRYKRLLLEKENKQLTSCLPQKPSASCLQTGSRLLLKRRVARQTRLLATACGYLGSTDWPSSIKPNRRGGNARRTQARPRSSREEHPRAWSPSVPRRDLRSEREDARFNRSIWPAPFQEGKGKRSPWGHVGAPFPEPWDTGFQVQPHRIGHLVISPLMNLYPCGERSLPHCGIAPH